MAPKSSLRHLCLFRPQNQSMSQRCGFFNVPSWVMEFKPGLTGWGGGSNGSPGHCVNRVRGICPPPLCVSWEARGNWRVDTERHSQVSVQVLATLEPSSLMERVLIHWISATCGSQPLARNHTVNEKTKAYLTSLQAKGPLEEPGLDPWGCISKSTFTIKINLHSQRVTGNEPSAWCRAGAINSGGKEPHWEGGAQSRFESLLPDLQDTWGQASWGITMGLSQELPMKQTAALYVPLTLNTPSADPISSLKGNNTEAACCFILYKGFDEPCLEGSCVQFTDANTDSETQTRPTHT